MDLLFEPAVLISLVIGLLIAMFSRRLENFGEYLLFKASLFSRNMRSKLRRKTWRHKRNLIMQVRCSSYVTRHIVRTYTLFIVFIISILFYALLVFMGYAEPYKLLPIEVQILIISPTYIIEILWLVQKEKMRALLRVSRRYASNMPRYQFRVKRLRKAK